MQDAGLLVQCGSTVFQISSDLKDLQNTGLQACNSKTGNNIITTLHLLENGFLYIENVVVLSYSQVFSYCLVCLLPVSGQAALWIRHSRLPLSF